MELINQSIVQISFEKLIRLFHQNSNEDGGEYKNLEEKEVEVEDLFKKNYKLPSMKKSQINSSANSSFNKKALTKKNHNNKFFRNSNFCNQMCYEKFSNVIKKLKAGEVDFNKINWSSPLPLPLTSASVTNENSEFPVPENLIQNLVNYYYSLGYNQAINEMSNN
jgi:hypothetical protein